MDCHKHKFYVGQLVENNHPNDCPLLHDHMNTHHMPTRIFRVKEMHIRAGHDVIVLEGFKEDRCYCTGTFRPVKPADPEFIQTIVKKKQKESIHG